MARPQPNGPRKPSSATWPAPWHFPARTRVPDALPSRHATPAMRSAAARSARSPLSRPGPNPLPQTLLPSPRSSLAYKNPQSSTVARLLLLHPPAVPPWPARSSSRGPATTALHCPIQPPQQLLHLPIELHACGIEPNPSPDAVPLLRRRRRARAPRGPASFKGDRARQLPQAHPQAHAVLVRALFPYPEPSFTSSTGEPNNRPAIAADELETVHQTLERRPS